MKQPENLPSHIATDAFFKQHGAYLPYILDDIQQDVRAIDHEHQIPGFFGEGI